jgi:hypothetical protein
MLVLETFLLLRGVFQQIDRETWSAEVVVGEAKTGMRPRLHDRRHRPYPY